MAFSTVIVADVGCGVTLPLSALAGNDRSATITKLRYFIGDLQLLKQYYPKIAALAMLLCQPAFAEGLTDNSKGVSSWTIAPLKKNVSATFYCTPDQALQTEAAWITWIGKQKKTIHINAYGFTDPSTCSELLEARKRGVDIKITMDSTEAATPKQESLVEMLQKAKIDLKIGKSPIKHALLHAKLAIGDDKSVVLGSWNVSPSANQQFNDFLIVDDAAVARYYDKFWQEIYDHLAKK